MMNTLDKSQVVKVFKKLNFSFHSVNVAKVSCTFIDIMGNVHVCKHRGSR
jgi:hypothetical protein